MLISSSTNCGRPFLSHYETPRLINGQVFTQYLNTDQSIGCIMIRSHADATYFSTIAEVQMYAGKYYLFVSL